MRCKQWVSTKTRPRGRCRSLEAVFPLGQHIHSVLQQTEWVKPEKRGSVDVRRAGSLDACCPLGLFLALVNRARATRAAPHYTRSSPNGLGRGGTFLSLQAL